MISDSDLVKQYKNHKKLAKSGLSRQYKNTKTCQAFYAGDTMNITGRVPYRNADGDLKYTLCQFNKVKPYVNAARGFLLQNKNKAKFAARAEKPAQRFYSQYVNDYHDYNRDNMRADQIESRQDLDLLVNGYGVTDTYLTFGIGYASRNPDGETGMMRLDPNMYWWDPNAREANLIDRKFDGYTEQYYLDDAKELFDAQEDDFEKALQSDDGDDYSFNPTGGVKNLIREHYDFADYEENLINVDFYQWCELQTYYRAYNPIYEQSEPEAVLNIKSFMDYVKKQTGDDDFDPKAEIINCSAETKEQLQEYMDIEFNDYKKQCFYSAVISGNKVFTKYKNISQDGFTRKAKTGDFDEKNKIWVGMVNAMIEPQKYFNKSITEFLYTIAYASKGGVMYEEDAIDDIIEFEANYAKPDKNVEVNSGALSGGKIQQKRESVQATGIEQVITLSDNAFPDVTGLPDGFLGTLESKNMTAALQRSQIKQAINTLASYVDSILLYQTEHARLMLDLMKELASFGGDRQFRIYDEEGEPELVPVKLDHFVNEYDIDIEEAPDTELERAERIGALSEMAALYAQGGDLNRAGVLFGVAIDDMHLDPRKKSKIMEALVPKEQVSPVEHQMLQQRVQQLEAVVQSGQLEKLQSETALNMAKIEETKAKSEKAGVEVVKTLEESRKIAKETDLATTENVTV